MKKLVAVLTVSLLTLSGAADAGSKCRSNQSAGRVVTRTHVVTSSTSRVAVKDIVDTAVGAGSFRTLVAAVSAAELVDTLKSEGPFTVFAPTDEAFARLPKGTVESLLKPENKARLQAILTYHVVPGRLMAADVARLSGAVTVQGQRIDLTAKSGRVTVDSATVVKADIACKNGVIHVIDRVILPSEKDIVDTAVGAGTFNTLAAALQAAGLVDTLKGAGPFTVFAPTDEAFARLPAGTIETLLKPENKDQLVAILTCHVVSGRVHSNDVVQLTSADTVNGKAVTIRESGGSVLVNSARVTATDIDAENGVIHVIDTVLLP